MIPNNLRINRYENGNNPCGHFNKKAFLLPDSIRSAAIYHAKIMETGEYMFRIHDCITGIRLRGNVTDPAEAAEAVAKLRCLARAAIEFADFIEENY